MNFEDCFIPEPNSGCWLWTAGVNRQGYGAYRHSGRRQLVAHRFSYERARGKIPDGMQLDHLCKIKGCVNPDHLEVVSSRENTLRGSNPAAQNARKTHCNRGHAFDEANTIIRNCGRRACRQCRKDRERHRAPRRR